MNSNDEILLRLRGVPAQKGDWKDKYDPKNPNKIAANDNDANKKGDPERRQIDRQSVRLPVQLREGSQSTKEPQVFIPFTFLIPATLGVLAFGVWLGKNFGN
ncbi:hypothetical protein [Hyphomicrobium sp. ghe19]|uniref:hypothetical protein n=1 Tax=Hyphomicrobium sp. ghe19 TaxID=2682968 RepID=UPI001366BCC0|nr:hypothetical protein HYPP_01506 [Hyphomicrobium sp. ghe19]